MTITTHSLISSFTPPHHTFNHHHHHRHHQLKPPLKPRAQLSLTTPQPPTSKPTPTTTGVIVIGAGLSGLAAAVRLHADNIPFLLLEAADAVGGRVRTDTVDGFLLDRGFQIFITGYPEARKILDYKTLDLKKFYSGAKVYYGGRFHTVADPLRHFSDAIQSLTNPIGSVFDKSLIALTRVRVLTQSDEQLLSGEETSTISLLKRIGFSDSIVDRFFRPFFGGIFFDRELETTSRLFDFIFKCLALGDNTLPAKGISAIPEQLAAKLPSNSIILNSPVASVDNSYSIYTVTLKNGEVLQSEYGVIVAVEEPEAVKLFAGELNMNNFCSEIKQPVRSTVCIYFSAERSQVPVDDPVLFINGSGSGIVNNMFFATNVAPSYGPPGKALVSVSLIGLYEDESDEDLRVRVVKELSSWFGPDVAGSWTYLKTYRVRFAQPNQCPPTDLRKNPKVGNGLYACGDYRTSATFDGALVSGREAAEALLKDRSLVRAS
ncbi:putative protoporphyrinogen oxidase [Helianthus annuus]|nr:putative protoporphyrinogen oxidase [Helianthus annuus]KAJ0517102.1 putative protoporphyrinogen oxidase [Helianthus annuus]KAJ0685108.1 putative protoporphyrinogen oxidase [Helianthus annuus]KAJ0689026.1 putative protoporphyrinogen oxidase [Helianthus annuus]KAJ0870274.1 putative protoporphyrinogen oxidase [Helianthus annuus]